MFAKQLDVLPIIGAETEEEEDDDDDDEEEGEEELLRRYAMLDLLISILLPFLSLLSGFTVEDSCGESGREVDRC